mmetsp:Transcript_5303/g.16846  ORF Transcript_5303/g.16846 Transcript_5303/m.16846 type:complete len:241 (-) Transcript_5303:264-986(-)
MLADAIKYATYKATIALVNKPPRISSIKLKPQHMTTKTIAIESAATVVLSPSQSYRVKLNANVATANANATIVPTTNAIAPARPSSAFSTKYSFSSYTVAMITIIWTSKNTPAPNRNTWKATSTLSLGTHQNETQRKANQSKSLNGQYATCTRYRTFKFSNRSLLDCFKACRLSSSSPSSFSSSSSVSGTSALNVTKSIHEKKSTFVSATLIALSYAHREPWHPCISVCVNFSIELVSDG